MQVTRPTGEAHDRNHRTPRILVVQDANQTSEAWTRAFHEVGYDVVVQSIERSPARSDWPGYQLVLLDMGVPALLSMISTLRDSDVRAPILATMPSGSVCDRVKALDHGADDCLVRPFAVDELLARVRALLRRERGGPPAAVRAVDGR